jgi:hypothetical protein
MFFPSRTARAVSLSARSPLERKRERLAHLFGP